MIRPSNHGRRSGRTRSPAKGNGSARRHDPQALPRDLLRPEAYPPPQPSIIEQRNTHASWVFLTDTEVWKVKRPVDYGFLDFSDASKRQRCCEAEVALGRRLAPDVYIGVAPIHCDERGYNLNGSGPIVDHAVRMRRLPDDDSAAVLLTKGRLTPAHLQRLAERLDRFYAASSTADDMGAPSVLAANIDENYAQTLPFAGRFLDRGLIEHLYHWQRERLATRSDRLLQRVANGRIREGHGDLRLEHVYFPNGEPASPLVIDPIEFNRRLRCGDAALDVSFLAMDLDAQHRPDLAAWFLSSFARASNDHDLYAVVDLFLSYRAWVRAKVACLVAADPRTPTEKASRKAREAADFLALAASYAQVPDNAPIVIVGGAIGSGKSTLANALCLELRLPVISSDETRKHLAGIPVRATGGAALYTEQQTARTYAEVLRRARAVLESGRGVILDGTFGDRATRGAVVALAREAGRPLRLIELDCEDRILRERLDQRQDGQTISDARADLLPRFRATYHPPQELRSPERIILNGCLGLDELVRQVRVALGAR